MLVSDRIRYNATPTWMRSFFNEAVEHGACWDVTFNYDPVRFMEVVGLLGHGVMEQSSAPTECGKAVDPKRFRTTRIKDFEADAAYVSASSSVLRKSDVRILSSDALTAAFKPPSAQALRSALQALLSMSVEFEARPMAASARALCAFCSYQILLTLHPFADGNGRVARYRMDTQLYRTGVAAPEVLVALHLMLRFGGTESHAAAWHARAGDFEHLFVLYMKRVGVAAELLRDETLQEGSYASNVWRRLKFG